MTRKYNKITVHGTNSENKLKACRTLAVQFAGIVQLQNRINLIFISNTDYYIDFFSPMLMLTSVWHLAFYEWNFWDLLIYERMQKRLKLSYGSQFAIKGNQQVLQLPYPFKRLPSLEKRQSWKEYKYSKYGTVKAYFEISHLIWNPIRICFLKAACIHQMLTGSFK